VLQVITSAQRRGPEMFSLALASALADHGWPVRTVAMYPSPVANALPVRVLGTRRLAIVCGLRREAPSAQLMIAFGSKTLPACAAAGFLASRPFIYQSIGDPSYWARTPARRVRTGVCVRRAKVVVALWPGAAASIARIYGVSQDRISVIPNARAAAEFPLVDEVRRAQARERLDLEIDRPVVAYLGALAVEKGVDAAIDAMVEVPDATFLVVGDGPERASLVRKAAGLLGPRARFLPPTNDPAGVLAAADVLVLPSLSEGLPGVLIEAGLSGIPVVATDVGGIREIVCSGETGLLVHPGDSDALAGGLRAALANGHDMGSAARVRCLERFEMAVVATAWHQLLTRLAAPDGAMG